MSSYCFLHVGLFPVPTCPPNPPLQPPLTWAFRNKSQQLLNFCSLRRLTSSCPQLPTATSIISNTSKSFPHEEMWEVGRRARLLYISAASVLLQCLVINGQVSASPPHPVSSASSLLHRKLHSALITQFPWSRRYLEFIQPVISCLTLKFFFLFFTQGK